MNLNYKTFGSGFPLIILHGLMGSLDNWQTLAKKLAEKYTVYIIDQRNHGRSPHSSEFNYEILSADLNGFYKQHNITKAHLIGHSMGGKTVMRFALDNPAMVEKLVVVDVAPVRYDDRHSDVFAALFNADLNTANERSEVEQALRAKLGDDETTIQFLLKGLYRDDNHNFKWRFNLESLHKAYTEISDEITAPKPYEGRVLFIKGQKSSYINPTNYSSIMDLFPNNELVEIKEAGHWVHAEKPAEFLAEVEKFLETN